MRRLRPLVLFACMTATTALSAQLAVAETGPKDQHEMECGAMQRHHGEHMQRLKKLAEKLGMTDQQKSQAWALLQKDRTENKPLFQALRSERHQLHRLVMSGSADEAAVRAESARIASIQADLAVKRAQQAKQLKALLTPEQASKLQSILDKREQKFRKSHGEHEGM